MFGGLAAVDGVSLECHVGRVHAVIGPNGAGKTTLINLLSGDLAPSAGRIEILGREVGGLPPHLSIFELGFADKGRIYYTTGRTRRFRVLAIGAKNSQKTDLEYLSRLPKGT